MWIGEQIEIIIIRAIQQAGVFRVAVTRRKLGFLEGGVGPPEGELMTLGTMPTQGVLLRSMASSCIGGWAKARSMRCRTGSASTLFTEGLLTPGVGLHPCYDAVATVDT